MLLARKGECIIIFEWSSDTLGGATISYNIIVTFSDISQGASVVQRCRHIWRLFRLSLRLIIFGSRSAHLAYLVHKSGRKTSIIIIIIWPQSDVYMFSHGNQLLSMHFNPQTWKKIEHEDTDAALEKYPLKNSPIYIYIY